MTDAKDTALRLAKLTDCEQSYVVGDLWSNGFAIVRLPAALPEPAALHISCGHAESGCGCDCERCANCVDATPACDPVGKCSRLEVTWGQDNVGRLARITTLAPDLVESAGAAKSVSITIGKKAGDWPWSYRCLRLEDGSHPILPTMGMTGHANADVVAAARKMVRPDIWRYTAKAGKNEDSPLLLGYRGAALVFLLAPCGGPACRAARPAARGHL